MATDRLARILSPAKIRREFADAFQVDSNDPKARARLIAALLAVFIPILLLQQLTLALMGLAVTAFLAATAVLLVAFVIALRGRGTLAGGLALAGLIAMPLLSLLDDQPSSMLVGVFLVQATFAALIIGLALVSFRPYFALLVVLFSGMLVVGYLTEEGTRDTTLVVAFAITVMLELISVLAVVVIFRNAEMRSRYAAESGLRATEERSRRIASVVGDVVYSIHVAPGPIYTVEWMSGRGAFADFTNLPEKGVFDVASFIHSDDLTRFNETLAPVLVGGSASSEVRLIGPNGQVRWVQTRAYGVRDPATGAVTSLVGLIEDIHDRKLAEQALRTERERYEDLVNSVDGVVYEFDTQSRETIFISRQVEALLGYPIRAFLDRPTFWVECIHPEDRERALQHSYEGIERGHNWDQHYRMLSADGRVVWVHDIVSLEHESDSPHIARGLALNETASQLAQQAEREQRRLREALRETTAAISATLDLDEVVDRVFSALQLSTPSDAADIMFIESGVARVFRARDFAGNADMDAMLAVQLPIETTPNLRRMLETGEPMLVHDVHNDREWVAFYEATWIGSTCGVPIRLNDQTIGFLNLTSTRTRAFTMEHAEFLATFADQIAIAVRNARLYEQTRRSADELAGLVKQRTAELELERERLSIMLDSTAEGIYYTEGATIRYANPALCVMVGYREDELIGQPTQVLWPPAGPDESVREQEGMDTLFKERVWRGDRKMRRKDGRLLDVGLTASVISPPDSREIRLVVLARDISREKALQAQQSNLVAYASHELRTPITNLKTRLYLLRRRPELLDEHVAILEEVTERMRRLVEDLLDLTRMERGITRLQRRVVDVVALAGHIYRLQLPEADRKGLRFTTNLPEKPIFVDADPERMTQVITNLVTNALNYTPTGGLVQLIVRPVSSGNGVLLQIKDSGVGIAPENLPYIFQPFYRVASTVEGAGLGLSIAREIVELHGGDIQVQSQAGAGSTFTVRLPVVEAPIAVAGSGQA